MRQTLFIVVALMLCLIASAETPPTIPMTFYGIVSTNVGTPDGQTLNATINGSSISTVINPSSTYSCGASSCNYYITINRNMDDTSSTEVVFSIDGKLHQQTGTFSPGAIVRLDFLVNMARLIIYKHVINDNGGAKISSDFNMTTSYSIPVNCSCGNSSGGGGCGCGGGASGGGFKGSENGTIHNFYNMDSVISYNVNEIADSGYAKSIGANCSGTIANGEIKSCTITNDDLAVSGNASNMNVSGNFTSIGVSINGTSASNSSTLNETLPVVISDNNTQLLNFSYNFSTATLSFSEITITKGTSSNGAAYVTVAGIDSSAIVGTKTIYIYNASSAFNYVCIKDADVLSVGQISSTCNGADETPVPCTGVNTNGYACALSGTTLTITGLTHSGVEQQYVAPTVTPPSSSGGGSSGGAAR